ncbi:MAG: 9-O-acetylesterase, partial [Bryobacteraceae bacterium]
MGPIARRVTREGSALRIWFDYAAAGLKTHEASAVAGFTIGGEAADARIDGGTVLVSIPSGVAPTEVRYAWGGNPV